ncbi:MAG: transglutaminase domain-containing protein [Bacteroidia bacterium]
MSAQESLVLSDTTLSNTKGCERDPLKLVNKLTEGKNTDKEKFDVIFTWVVKNIHYNYYSYLSPSGAAMPRIERILKYKSGICIDYAYLMDTLCSLAGIRNISVYGYAKDDLFDVNDSIYMDNHVWNAVKLNNYWYLYDATWSSGKYKWRYTKFSKRIVDRKKKLLSKGKEKTITFKTTRITECDTTHFSFDRTYISLSLRHKILLKLLSVFKIKKRLYFVRVARPDFYLTEPKVFAITHFPDNPYWSLTGNNTSMRNFETDSAYYNLSDSVYIKQKRESNLCLDCDNYFSLDDMNKQKQMRNNSYKFNQRNRFITWLCNYNIGNIFYTKSLPETDSLTKISMIDSSLSYFSTAKNDLHQCIMNVSKENQLQREKNSLKSKILYEENKKHINFIHAIIASTYKETTNMKHFSQESKVAVRRFRIKKKKLHDITDKVKIKSSGFRTKENILEIRLKLKKDEEVSDSLNELITSLLDSYNKIVPSLSDNLWKKIRLQDSLARPFENGSFYRWLYLLDNYKKIVVEERKKIGKYENKYALDLRDSIFILSDLCSEKGLQIFKLLEKRNELFTESAKFITILTEEKIIGKDSLKKFTKLNTDKIQENICWIIGGSSKLKSIVIGYKILLDNQELIEQIIKGENRDEYGRYRAINKEIVRRKIKFSNIPRHNLRVTSNRKNFVTHYKRKYLQSLKEERKKAKKNNQKVK